MLAIQIPRLLLTKSRTVLFQNTKGDCPIDKTIGGTGMKIKERIIDLAKVMGAGPSRYFLSVSLFDRRNKKITCRTVEIPRRKLTRFEKWRYRKKAVAQIENYLSRCVSFYEEHKKNTQKG